MKKTYSAKELPPPVQDRVYPMEIRHKKAASVTIYETRNRTELMFTVAYPLDGQRVRKMRRNFEEAFSLAQTIALQLGDGSQDVLILSDRPRFAYERAIEILSTLNLELDVAAARFVDASKLAGGPEYLVEAARFYAESKKTALPPKMVADVVAELIASRRSNGTSDLYLRDLRLRLEKRFVAAFRVPIASISTSDIEEFLHDVNGRPRTKKNFLTAIGTLFQFAKKRGYLPDSHPGISKVEFSAESTSDIEIFTPEEMGTLLMAAKPALVPALAIGAFAGLRSEEIKKLDWSEVKSDEFHIEVLASNAKTRNRRVVPISDNLAQWLTPFRKSAGPVFPFANLASQFDKLSKITKVAWRRNGLRHSYISYRVAMVQSAEGVALEAGNSAVVIRRNYLQMVPQAKAIRWFSINPPEAANIIPMHRPNVATAG